MLVKKSRKMKYNNKRKNLRKNTRYFSKKKSRKSKSRKLKSRKSKNRKSKSKKLKQIKGGYGKGSCPFVDSSKFRLYRSVNSRSKSGCSITFLGTPKS